MTKQREYHCDAIVKDETTTRRCYAVPAPYKVRRQSAGPLCFCEAHKQEAVNNPQEKNPRRRA